MIDSPWLGLVALLVLAAMVWFVVSRARRGYQALSAVMSAAASSAAKADSTASSNVNVHVGHSVGGETSFSDSRTVSSEDPYEAEIGRRVAEAARQIRESHAHEVLGLPPGSYDPALFAPAASGRSGRSSFFTSRGADDDGARHLFDFRGDDDDSDVVGHVLAAEFDAESSNVEHIGGSFDWFDPQWRDRALGERAGGAGVSRLDHRGVGGGR